MNDRGFGPLRQRLRALLLARHCLAILLLLTACAAFAQNQTVLENQKTGTTAWQITSPATTGQIEGYASLTSVNRGGQISLFVNTSAATYTIDIYRMGWYAGAGGRLVMGGISRTGTKQTIPSPDPTTGMVECNWTNPYILMIPTPANDPTNNWNSGVYLAKLTAGGGKQAYIMFVVRDDARGSKVLFQSSVTTFAAYNTWGGKTLYDFQSPTGRANKVSFNRPYALTSNAALAGGVGASEFLIGGNDGSNTVAGWEYCMVRFLEREGYDVSYSTDVDTHENAAGLQTHKLFLSVGHDEYWSWEMRQNVTAARNAGVSLCFFSANTCYWQIRLEPSPINGVADRTVVCYKGSPDSTISTGTLDPYYTDSNSANDNLITVRWRDSLTRSSRVAMPEEALIGTQYDFGADDVNSDMVITNASNWVFANTGLINGSTLPSLVGYECDRMQGSSPAGTVDLAHSPYTGNTVNTSGTGFSDMTVYTASSGATVFATGSIKWSWGLDDWGAPNLRSSLLNPAAQQIARNVLARAQGIPVAIPGGPYRANPGVAITFNGTASYDPNGTITAYNWNFGDGATATGPTPTHAYAATNNYTVTLTVTDNFGNQNSATTVANIGKPYMLWDDAVTPTVVADDPNSVELGVRFQADQDGYIIGVQFYKSSLNTGIHVGSLWTSAGQLLAQATFTNETATGWQQVTFSNPVQITKNTVYIASYHAPNGTYVASDRYFATSGYDNVPLHALKDGVSGANGIYAYNPNPVFPDQTYQSENYWVDVLFLTSLGPDVTPPTVVSVSPAAGATGVAVNTAVTVTFSEAMSTASITTATILLKDAANNTVPASVTYNSANNSATLTPNSALAVSTMYTLSVLGGSAGVKDAAGNALASTFTSSFTTTVPDTTPPTVIAVSPAAGATNVPVSTVVTVKFSEAMTASTISASTFRLTNPVGTVIPATVTYSAATNTATMTPTSPLAANTTYTATVVGGSSGVKDLAGNALVSNFTWTFTTSQSGIAIDKMVTTHQSSAATTIVSPTFSTSGSNELLLAFLTSDGPGGTISFSSVSGGGLTWTLRKRANSQKGTAEIWQAVAANVLSNVSVTAARSSGSWMGSITVVAFTGADTTTNGATGGGSAASGAPTASLTTTKAGSWVWGVGDDWDNAIARTVGANQTKVDEFLASSGDTFWVQSQTNPTPNSGTSVTINDTAPTTDRWNLAIIEIRAQ